MACAPYLPVRSQRKRGLMAALQEALSGQPSMAGSVVDMSASWSAKVAIDFEQQV